MQRMLLVMLMLSIPGITVAGVYRWTDENGRVHFGDRPAGDTAEEVKIRQRPASAASAEQEQGRESARLEQRRRTLQMLEDARHAREEAADQAREQRRESRENCTRSKKMLAHYQRLNVLYRDLPDGTRQYLSATERRQEEDRVRDEIERWCGEAVEFVSSERERR